MKKAKTFEHAQSIANRAQMDAMRRQEAYCARKQAMDYSSTPNWPWTSIESVIERASKIEKYLTTGAMPKAVKKTKGAAR